MTELKTFTDAAKLDILEQLEKPNPLASTFKRVAEISGIASALCNGFGAPREHDTIAEAIQEAENKAPRLFEALKNRAFNGESLLTKKYNELTTYHNDLRKKALDIAAASDEAARKTQELELHETRLKNHAKELEREQERLMIVAEARKVSLVLPPMPTLDGEVEEP